MHILNAEKELLVHTEQPTAICFDNRLMCYNSQADPRCTFQNLGLDENIKIGVIITLCSFMPKLKTKIYMLSDLMILQV